MCVYTYLVYIFPIITIKPKASTPFFPGLLNSLEKDLAVTSRVATKVVVGILTTRILKKNNCNNRNKNTNSSFDSSNHFDTPIIIAIMKAHCSSPRPPWTFDARLSLPVDAHHPRPQKSRQAVGSL